jgi:hypothetical protein
MAQHHLPYQGIYACLRSTSTARPHEGRTVVPGQTMRKRVEQTLDPDPVQLQVLDPHGIPLIAHDRRPRSAPNRAAPPTSDLRGISATRVWARTSSTLWPWSPSPAEGLGQDQLDLLAVLSVHAHSCYPGAIADPDDGPGPGKALAMTLVNGQAERDVAIYRAWIDGATQADLAERYGVTQSAISYAIRRVLDDFPEPDKAAEVRRTLDQVEELVAVYLPKALAGDAGANREYRGLAALKARYLGIDRREVEVHVDGQLEHVTRPVEPMETVVERILAKALTTRGNGQDQDIVEAEIVEEAGNGG